MSSRVRLQLLFDNVVAFVFAMCIARSAIRIISWTATPFSTNTHVPVVAIATGCAFLAALTLMRMTGRGAVRERAPDRRGRETRFVARGAYHPEAPTAPSAQARTAAMGLRAVIGDLQRA